MKNLQGFENLEGLEVTASRRRSNPEWLISIHIEPPQKNAGLLRASPRNDVLVQGYYRGILRLAFSAVSLSEPQIYLINMIVITKINARL